MSVKLFLPCSNEDKRIIFRGYFLGLHTHRFRWKTLKKIMGLILFDFLVNELMQAIPKTFVREMSILSVTIEFNFVLHQKEM